MIIKLLTFTFLLTLGIIGSFIILGFILGFFEKKTSKNFYNKFGKKFIIITGIIGTSTHELGHYIMCKIFLHKVSSIKLCSFKLEGDNLGYVSHSYNKKSIYQRVGNFFIGIGPILFGTFVISLLFYLLYPNKVITILNSIDYNNYLNLAGNFNSITFFKELGQDALIMLKNVLAFSNFFEIKFWIFLFIALSISIHMSLSTADLKNSIDGILFILLLSFFVSLIIMFLGISLSNWLQYIIIYNLMIISFLMISLIFSILAFIISSIISFI